LLRADVYPFAQAAIKPPASGLVQFGGEPLGDRCKQRPERRGERIAHCTTKGVGTP
jgi:hypothetical protein